MIRCLFIRRVVRQVALGGIMLVGSSAACFAESPHAGWATAPQVRADHGDGAARQLLPGWSGPYKLDPRIKIFEPRGPRAFGLLTGDKVRHVLRIEIARPYRLQRSSLPPVRWVTSWLELQGVEVREAQRDAVNRYGIALNYQIFSTPRAVTLDVIPGFELVFTGPGGRVQLEVPEWVYSISPLLKPEPEVEAIAEIPLRADAPPPLIDTSRSTYGAIVFGGLTTLFGMAWLYFSSTWPFRPRAKRPFRQACGALRRIGRGTVGEPALRQAFRLVHQAFNDTAGEVVFAEHLERFFTKRPGFESQRQAVETFFGRSRQLFFSDAGRPEDIAADLEWLKEFCRRCALVEREAA